MQIIQKVQNANRKRGKNYYGRWNQRLKQEIPAGSDAIYVMNIINKTLYIERGIMQ